MEGPNKDEADLKQVFLGEKSFTFPSDQLGRLHDHTGMHRSRTSDWKIEQFRFNRDLYSDLPLGQATGMDCVRSCLKKVKAFYLNNTIWCNDQWTMIETMRT